MSFFILLFCNILIMCIVLGLLIYFMFDATLTHCVLIGIVYSIINFLVSYVLYHKYLVLQKDNVRLSQGSRTDNLTGLLNRAVYEQDIKQIEQEGVSVSSVLFIDIDNFRIFNNKFGHMAGDCVLKKVSATIRESLRTSDKVYRYGGEEIVVLLIDCGKENAYRLAERIRVNINELDNSPYHEISVSIGISTYPEDSDNIRKVIEKSDRALLRAKSKGKNRTEEDAQ